MNYTFNRIHSLKMYAYIVDNLWSQYPNKNYAEFLRVVGTPALVTDPDGVFNSVSGFYVKVENGWFIRYKSKLQLVDFDLSLESLSLGQ